MEASTWVVRYLCNVFKSFEFQESGEKKQRQILVAWPRKDFKTLLRKLFFVSLVIESVLARENFFDRLFFRCDVAGQGLTAQ